MTDGAGAQFDRLREIMRILRSPEGCPWDREQTHASLRPFVLEETHELLEALDSGSADAVREELGDFLFEAVFLAQLSEEAGDFTMAEVLDGVCTKLVLRHPHVFERREGDEAPATGAQVLERWSALKARERAASGRPPKPPGGLLDGVPPSLPALHRAHTLATKAASAGFDWVEPRDVLDKIEEEVGELREHVKAGALTDRARAEEEMGDLLFAIANLSRKLGVEPEAALRRANAKFSARFAAMEEVFRARGRDISGATLEEQEAAWQQVKAPSASTPDGRRSRA